MGMQDIASSEVGNMKGTEEVFSVDSQTTDGGQNDPWYNRKYNQYLGYYKSIPELKSTIDTKSKWTVGKGIIADKKTMKIIDDWRGFGKDTANTLIQNFVKTYYVGGDSFSEIIRDESLMTKIKTWFGIVKTGKVMNLKPLDPGTIGILTNKEGMLEGYEQTLTSGETKTIKRFNSEDIFHLPKNRFADEIHGTGIITAIEEIILMRNESMQDMKIVFHRYVQPFNVFRLDTDDPVKIKAFIAKENARNKDKENMFLPMGTVDVERIAMPQFSTLDPLPWIRDLTDYFYQATNTPDVVVGSAKQTVEASAKILFLGFEQSVRDDQQFIMENFKSQLGLDIKLEFPTPIEESIVETEKKAGDEAQASKKSDTTAGSGK